MTDSSDPRDKAGQNDEQAVHEALAALARAMGVSLDPGKPLAESLAALAESGLDQSVLEPLARILGGVAETEATLSVKKGRFPGPGDSDPSP